MARSFKKRTRKYRPSYARRKPRRSSKRTYKIALAAAKNYMNKNSERLNVVLKHELVLGSAYALSWRPLDPQFTQGNRRYVAGQGNNNWGNANSLEGYTTSEGTYACVTGNQMKKTKCTIKIEADPRVIGVNTLTGSVDVFQAGDFTAISGNYGLLLQNLQARIRVWIVSAPRGKTDTQLLQYLVNTYNVTQTNCVWGVTGNTWDTPHDKTQMTLLKSREFQVSWGGSRVLKMSVKKACATYKLPTDGSGALEYSRPQNGKKFIVIFVGGTSRFTDTSPTPDVQYNMAAQISCTLYNSYVDL